MSLTYRKDIDGLRAIAVLLVILAHAHFTQIAGGFIGVDVFFVISGYLITSILRKEMDTNSFSITNFYLRRIRRLLPALSVTILGTAIACWAILLPNDMQKFATSAFSGFTAWANVYFGRIDGGYWGQDVSVMPLTHLWSLAVEEQFYFVWPLLLFALRKRIPSKHLPYVLTGLFAILFAISVAKSGGDKGYYSFPARAFEMLMGASVALLWPTNKKIRSTALATILDATGIALIAYSATMLTANIAFPGFNALWPCLGTIALLLPKERQTLFSFVLKSPPLTYIGKISYSLYLWHWPIFALILYSGLSLKEWRTEAIAATFLLATTSYYAVEQPFRRKRFSNKKTVGILFVAPLSVIAIFASASQLTKGFNFRYSAADVAMIEASTVRASKKYSGCHERGKTALPQLNLSQCYWGTQKPSPDQVDLLLVGDSHASAIRGFVEELSNDAAISGIQLSASSTPYLPGVDFYYDKNGQYPQSELAPGSARYGARSSSKSHNNLVTEYIANSDAQYVVLAGRFTLYTAGDNARPGAYMLHLPDTTSLIPSQAKNEKTFATAMNSAIANIIIAGKIPVVIKDVPEMEQNRARDAVYETINNTPTISTPKKQVLERQQAVDSTIDDLAEQYPELIVIDPKKLMCPTEDCYATLENTPLYYDADHLNYAASRFLGKKYIETYGNPLKQKSVAIKEK